MRGSKQLSKCCVLFLALATVTGSAANTGNTEKQMAPNERGRAIAIFVKRWAGYATEVYNVDVRTWSSGFVTQFAKADASKIRRALSRTTYEGALAELDGRGEILSDDMVIDRLAKLPQGASPSIVSNAFGEIVGGLQYTPIQPCRILDTRTAEDGPLAQGESRNIHVAGVSSYLHAGGADNNCGLIEAGLKAAALNVTVVNPEGPGFATIYNPAYALPNASSLNFTTGAIVNNTVITSVFPGEVGSVGSIQLRSTRAAHYVVDIVGYYETPKARVLQCTEVNTLELVQPGVPLPVPLKCPAGYSVTGGGAFWRTGGSTFIQLLDAGNIYTYPNTSDLYAQNHSFISVGFNKTEEPVLMEARATCCRVPGR